MTPNDARPAPRSLVLHSMAGYYDLLAQLLTLGRERQLRERLATLAALEAGESVLDVGCGTGSLALAAKRRVGRTGTVVGVDASPEMIGRARRKASKAGKAGLGVEFELGRAEALPFPDATFDVVLSTLMMHHLPRATRESFAAEIRRVLRPGGRVLVVDFEKSARARGGLIARFHRHGHVPLADIVDLLGRAGLRVSEMGSVGAADLRYALAVDPRGDPRAASAPPIERSHPALPMPGWLVPLGLAAVVAAHAVIVRRAWAALGFGTMVFIGPAALLIGHLGIARAGDKLVGRNGKHTR